MDKHGPLFHRNGAHFLPSWFARTFIGVVFVVGTCEFVLGLVSCAK